MVDIITENKTCIECGEGKDLSGFEFIKKTGKYRNQCKVCINKFKRERRLKNRSPETIEKQILMDQRIVGWKKDNPGITTQICGQCKHEKLLDAFELRNDTGKYRSICSKCEYENKQFRKEEPLIKIIETFEPGFKRCTGDCKEIKAENEGNFYFRNDSNKFRDDCIVCFQEANKEYIIEHREEVLAHKREYYQDNIEYFIEYRRDEKTKERNRLRRKERRLIDINFRIMANLRGRFHNALRGRYKSGSAVRDLGCSIEYLIGRLESKFHMNSKTGEIMSWYNYGFYGWHIDHIIPLDYFDLTNREEFLVACNYKNLQPLWANKNYSKSDNLPDNFEELLAEIKADIAKSRLIAKLSEEQNDDQIVASVG